MSYAPKVTIDMSRYVKLLEDEALLDCLYNNDLESWERYSESIEDYGKSFPSNRESPEEYEPMSKHTPGPWEVHNGTDVYPVDDEKARFYVADCDPDNAPVASSLLEPGEHPNTDATYEQAKANARLIAAAPDMLEALLAVREACFFEDDNGIGVSEDVVIDSDLFDRICRAINKAEGRS